MRTRHALRVWCEADDPGLEVADTASGPAEPCDPLVDWAGMIQISSFKVEASAFENTFRAAEPEKHGGTPLMQNFCRIGFSSFNSLSGDFGQPGGGVAGRVLAGVGLVSVGSDLQRELHLVASTTTQTWAREFWRASVRM